MVNRKQESIEDRRWSLDPTHLCERPGGVLMRRCERDDDVGSVAEADDAQHRLRSETTEEALNGRLLLMQRRRDAAAGIEQKNERQRPRELFSLSLGGKKDNRLTLPLHKKLEVIGRQSPNRTARAIERPDGNDDEIGPQGDGFLRPLGRAIVNDLNDALAGPLSGSNTFGRKEEKRRHNGRNDPAKAWLSGPVA